MTGGEKRATSDQQCYGVTVGLSEAGPRYSSDRVAAVVLRWGGQSRWAVQAGNSSGLQGLSWWGEGRDAVGEVREVSGGGVPDYDVCSCYCVVS